MTFNYFKLGAVLSLGILLVTYTNCGQPFNKPSDLVFSSNVYGGGSDVSYNAFEKTLYPLTRANCVACHDSIQPQHASSNVRTAHDAVISGFKVNFANIQASRLVAKLRDEKHNCWGDCAENASQIQSAIEKWNDAIKDSGVSTTPDSAGIFTAETDTLENEFLDSTNPLKTNSIKINVDAAMLKSPMIKSQSPDDGAYLWVPTVSTTTLGNNDVNAGTANMNFRVPATGTYQVWALGNAPTNTEDSFYVNVKNGNTSVIGGVKTWTLPVNTKFDWRRVSNFTANLNSTTSYTLELRQREDGAKVAGFIVTSDTSFNGEEIDDYFGITLSFDISNQVRVPGVKLLIDVIDYDLYSYKFSKPRIVSPSANIYVKGLKLYVNDIYSPQHSTYTLVDKIITPTENILSDYSMIVIKDRGPAGDHIKFSFDVLTPTNDGGSNGGTGGSTGGVDSQTSLMAFQSTVYPISRSSSYSCVSCHINVSPRHASPNTLTAHDAALSVVDFNNPSNSRIVKKMRDEQHNCGTSCSQLANQYQEAITEWKARRE